MVNKDPCCIVSSVDEIRSGEKFDDVFAVMLTTSSSQKDTDETSTKSAKYALCSFFSSIR
jgi:hypothetical protein